MVCLIREIVPDSYLALSGTTNGRLATEGFKTLEKRVGKLLHDLRQGEHLREALVAHRDELDALNAGASFVPGSLSLVGALPEREAAGRDAALETVFAGIRSRLTLVPDAAGLTTTVAT